MINTLYKKYERMVMQAAHKTCRAYSTDFGLAKEQALSIFHDAYLSWDKEQASFSTHLFNQLKAMPNWAKGEKRMVSMEDHETAEGFSSAEIEGFFIQETANNTLSSDAHKLFNILNDGGIFANDCSEHSHRLTKDGILAYCKESLGWNWGRGFHAYEELEHLYLENVK